MRFGKQKTLGENTTHCSPSLRLQETLPVNGSKSKIIQNVPTFGLPNGKILIESPCN
jgi:hypothetical protein